MRYEYRVYVPAENYAELIAPGGDLNNLVNFTGIVNDGDYARLLGEYRNGTISLETLISSVRNIKNYVRSFEQYGVAFVQNEKLLNQDAIYSIDVLFITR